MGKWRDVTDTFSESQRYYKDVYLEICEVYEDEDDVIEVNLYSSETEPYEIYFSWDIFYGIVYADKEKAYDVRENIKAELIEEFSKDKKPSGDFINSFVEKYDVCMPSDILFDEDAFMEAFLNLWD